MSRRWSTEIALLAIGVIGAVALARLTTGGSAARWIVLAALVGELVAAAVSVRTNRIVALCVGTVAVLVVAVEAAARAHTWHGVPTPAALRTLAHALGTTGSLHFPVIGNPGIVAAGVLVAGLAAVDTRVLPGPAALLPTMVLVTWSTAALPSTGAAIMAVAFVGAGAVVLLAGTHDLTGWMVSAGAVAAGGVSVLLLAAVAAAGTAAAPPIGGAVSPGGPVAPAVPPTALSLVAHLTALEVNDPDLVMFTAVTPVPTYWQVATLSQLEGDGTWMPDTTTDVLLSGLVPTGGQSSLPPPSGQTFTAAVTIEHLASHLLPVPPETVSASSAYVTGGLAMVPNPTAPGQRYSAQAPIPQQVPSDATATADLPDTALPPLPPVVTQLARSVTASATTPLQKAEALTDWFRSRLFHYSLRASSSSLVSFLTTSRTGSCQQFAGAFAVLARAVGLPTRVAIGFTTGHPSLSGVTVVRGIDAHAWPQVLLDGRWTSFEPTPQQPSGELSPPGVLGPAGQGNPNPAHPLGGQPVTHPLPLPHPNPVPAPKPATVHHNSGMGSGWLWALVAIPVVVAGFALERLRRRRRSADPVRQVARAWRRIDRALVRCGLARPASRTPTDHAAHLTALAAASGTEQFGAALRDVGAVAAVVEQMAYAGRIVNPAEAAEVDLASRRAARALRHADTDELARRAAHPPSGDGRTAQSPRTGRSTSPV